jgi:hypothetical protein
MRATTWSVPVLLLLLGLLIAKPSEGFALMRPLRHHSLISSYSSPSTTARRANTDEEAAEAAEETAAEETAAEETAAEDDPVAKAAAKKASFEKEEERIAALKARLDAANRAVSNKAGRVFVPEAAGPAFARCVAMPTVLPPSELSGGKWRMFFYGRSDDSWNGGRPAFLPTGKCGLAESDDGLTWTAVEGGGEDGTILGPSEEADAWDHVHTGSVDVHEILPARDGGEEGGYEMLYLGGSAEAVDLGGPGSQFGPLEGFRMRGGVARGSADGKVWTKSPLNPVLDVGGGGGEEAENKQQKEWDSTFASWPRAVPLDPTDKEGQWLLTYHSLQPPNDAGEARWAAGAAVT